MLASWTPRAERAGSSVRPGVVSDLVDAYGQVDAVASAVAVHLKYMPRPTVAEREAAHAQYRSDFARPLLERLELERTGT